MTGHPCNGSHPENPGGKTALLPDALSSRVKGNFNNSLMDLGDALQKVSSVLPLSSERRDLLNEVVSDLRRVADVDRTVLIEVVPGAMALM